MIGANFSYGTSNVNPKKFISEMASKKKAMTTGKQKPPTEDDEAEEDGAAVDPDDTKEDEDKEFGTVEYLTDRVLEDGVLWWGVHWLETQEATWCLDTNIPRISKYNKMRTAGEKGEFMLRFDGQNQNKRKRGKTRGKDSRKGGPLPAALQAELDARSSIAVAALQSLPPPPLVDAAFHWGS